jgi:hypothetical protein
MTKPTWRFWLTFGVLAAGAHLLFAAGWSQNSQTKRSCGCLIELDGSEYCKPVGSTESTQIEPGTSVPGED